MASLIPTPARKADDAPRNENEARNTRARAANAAWNTSWGSAKKADAPAGAVHHLSAPGRTTMREAARHTVARKADVLAALPARAKAIAQPLADGQKAFVAKVYERHTATGQPVSFTRAEAGSVMGLSADAAGKTADGLVSGGLLKPIYGALGSLAGYVPVILS